MNVPPVFQPPTSWEYPRHNPVTFEEFFCNYYAKKKVSHAREYLPIWWSNFYYSRHFRNDGTADLQKFLDGLDRKKQYFTVVVYDGGIHEKIDGLDLKIFSAVGHTISPEGTLGDRAIPIICRPAPNINRNRQRDIFAGFIGAKTHPMRDVLWSTLKNEHGFVLEQSCIYPNMAFQKMTPENWAKVNYEHFQDMMERSVFALCPRGNSTVSFRVCESLQYGCVPVYISDKFWFPWSNPKDKHDHGVFDNIGVTCHSSEISLLPQMLRSIPQAKIDEYLENGRALHQSHFSFEGCADRIIEEACL